MNDELLGMWGKAFAQCLEGLPLTLGLTFFSLLIGGLIALPLAVIHSKRYTWSAKAVKVFTFLFTGTPLLVQLYIFYDGVGSMQWVQELMTQEHFGFLRDGYFWVMLGLVLNTAAYSTIIFSGAINNTENGEVEAGRAYGMNSSQVMRHIILPSSLRRALPAYSNEVILMLQATALASSFTLFEITGQAVRFNSTHYQPFVAYIPAAVMYLVMTYILVMVFKLLEKRYLAHLKPRSH